MGNYNPHAPYIIGQEWVPIRDARYAPEDFVEKGYVFRVDHTVTPVTGAYYVVEVPDSRVDQACDLIAVYPRGQDWLSGPVKKINIPVSAIAITGASIVASAGFSALLNPSDDQSIRFSAPSDNNSSLAISFAVDSYSQQLMGKRILDVSFRYSMATGSVTSGTQAADALDITTTVGFLKDMVNQSITYNVDGMQTTVVGAQNQVNSFSITDLNPFWDATRSPHVVRDIYPWRFQELSRFSATAAAASRMVLQFFNGISSDSNGFLYFVDMEVTYCEETRVLYGGRRTANLSISGNTDAYDVGANLVRLLDTNFTTATTTLTPGEYAVTLTHNDFHINAGFDGAPQVAALRELYGLPAQRGVVVSQTLTVDEEFTEVDTPVITEITLHTASAVVTGVHPYGIQDDIPVYGTITAIQEIEDDPVGSVAKSYPQVRFYARRFGNTSVPLQLVDVATGLSTVSISVEDFDALTEIVDGWREVNLTFTTAPSFSTAAGDIDWRWQAISELARNQWQILGAGSQTFSAHSIGTASYYAPQGNTVTLTWQSPTISGTADDTLSDAVLIFSQDPLPVTGFAVTQASQDLGVVADACGVNPRCIPTALQYNQLSWPLPRFTGYSVDTFTRVATNGWGSTETGGTWTDGGNSSNFAVNGSYATISPNGTSARLITTPLGVNFDVSMDLGVVSAVVATSTAHVGIIGRHTDTSNYYFAELQVAPTTGVTTLALVQRVAGSNTTLASLVLPTDYTANAGAWLRMRFMGQDDRFKVKVWHRYEDEPDSWLIEVTSTSLTSGTGVGAYAQSETVATNVLAYDNFEATPPRFWFGYYEIQRRDALTDWQTIMQATSPAVTGFADYEARVGIASEYRIRQCNVLDFCGSTWVTGTGTIPAPGVTTAGDGNSVLIFTSNQGPTGNLAYPMEFEGQPIETFAFPEANELVLQRMYGKDFFTAFHPLERGGTQFTRNILVNAAAIAAPSLPNFVDLRDLGWAALNYVCVRDELGNRWFANVRVPEGNVRLDRTVYVAQIQVSEVTDTPTPVDPEVG
jgi:hypothetical protein